MSPPDPTSGSAAPDHRRRGPERVPLRLPAPETLAAATRLPPASFIDSAAELGVAFEPGDIERLGLFLAYLLWANERINLTSIRDPAQAWTRHILDAITLLGPLSQLPPGAAVIDIGSGSGIHLVLERIRVVKEGAAVFTYFDRQSDGVFSPPNLSVLLEHRERGPRIECGGVVWSERY